MAEVENYLERIGGEPVMTSKDVCVYLNLSRSALYKLQKNDSTFPAPCPFAKNPKKWFASDIYEWFGSHRKSANAPSGEVA